MPIEAEESAPPVPAVGAFPPRAPAARASALRAPAARAPAARAPAPAPAFVGGGLRVRSFIARVFWTFSFWHAPRTARPPMAAPKRPSPTASPISTSSCMITECATRLTTAVPAPAPAPAATAVLRPIVPASYTPLRYPPVPAVTPETTTFKTAEPNSALLSNFISLKFSPLKVLSTNDAVYGIIPPELTKPPTPFCKALLASKLTPDPC